MSQSTVAAAPEAGSSPPRSMRSILLSMEIDTRMLGLIGATILIWIGFNILSGGSFLTTRNLWNLSVQSAAVAVMATGMVLIIVSRNIDLSIGSILGFTGMVMALMQAEWLPAARSRLQSPAHLDHRPGCRRHRRRGDRRPAGRADRLRRHPLVHRHPRRAARLARLRVDPRLRADDRPARCHLPAAGRWAQGIGRSHHLVGHRRPRRRRTHLRALQRSETSTPIRLPGPADVGRGHDRRGRQRRRPGRGLDRQQLLLAGGPRTGLRRGQRHPVARGRADDPDRHRQPGPDRDRRRRSS